MPTIASSQPTIQLLDVNGDRARFRVDNCTLGLMNALRRSPLTDLPTLAIDKIVIRTRTLVITDNIVADALERIPIISSAVEEFFLPSNRHAPLGVPSIAQVCRCADGCPRCERAFQLKYKHTTLGTVAHITTKDLVPIPHPKANPAEQKSFGLRDSTVVPNEACLGEFGLPLFSMHYMQEIDLIAYVRRGNTLQHARWKPGECAFRPIFDLAPPNNARLRALGITLEQKQKMVAEDNDAVWKLDLKTEEFYITDPLRYVKSKNLWEMLNSFLVHNKNATSDDHGPALFPAQMRRGSFLFVLSPYGHFPGGGLEMLERTVVYLMDRLLRMMKHNALAHLKMTRSRIDLNDWIDPNVRSLSIYPQDDEVKTLEKDDKVVKHLEHEETVKIQVLTVMISEEDTTIVNPCCQLLQSNPEIMSATYQASDPQECKMYLRIQTKNNADPSVAWHESMLRAKSQLQNLRKQLQAIKEVKFSTEGISL